MTTTTMNLPRPLRREEPEWVVWLLVGLLLIAGVAVKAAVTGRTEQLGTAGVTLEYPAGWTRTTGDDPAEGVRAGDPLTQTAVRVRSVPAADFGRNLTTLTDLALAWSSRSASELSNYSTLGVESDVIQGTDVVRIEYAYVVPPAPSSVPTVVRAEDVLIQRGDIVSVVTFTADATTFEDAGTVWQTILASLNLQ